MAINVQTVISRKEGIAVGACLASIVCGLIAIAMKVTSLSMILFLVNLVWFAAAFAVRTPGSWRLHHSMTQLYREAKAGTLERQLPIARVINLGGIALTVAYIATALKGM